MNDQLLSRLQEMKLSGMAEAYKEQSLTKEYQSISFEDRYANGSKEFNKGGGSCSYELKIDRN